MPFVRGLLMHELKLIGYKSHEEMMRVGEGSKATLPTRNELWRRGNRAIRHVGVATFDPIGLGQVSASQFSLFFHLEALLLLESANRMPRGILLDSKSREIGSSLPNNQCQHRALHI